MRGVNVMIFSFLFGANGQKFTILAYMEFTFVECLIKIYTHFNLIKSKNYIPLPSKMLELHSLLLLC